MHSNDFRIRLTHGETLPVLADGMQIHESGAVVFVDLDANNNPVPSLIVSPMAYQRVWGMGPAQPQPQQPQPPANRATRRAKK